MWHFVGEENCSGVVGSSRTDKGVHALRNVSRSQLLWKQILPAFVFQVFHVDMVRRRRQSGAVMDPHSANTVQKGLNYHLKREQVSITC